MNDRIMKSNKSWQKRIRWIENINNYSGKRGMSKEYLKVLYDNDLHMFNTSRKKLSDRVTGKNNPGFSHGGKFSIYSKYNPNYSDANRKKALEKNKSAQLNGSSIRTIQYWMNKGFSREKSKEKLSEHQATFSKEKCIEKYGYYAGIEIWQARQDKWQNTLNLKSDDETAKINRKKSTKINYKSLWKKKLDYPGILYLIEIDNNHLKIGITTKTIKDRFNRCNFNYVVIHEYKTTISKAFEIEQLILRRFKEYRFTNKHTTENLKIDCLNNLQECIFENEKRSYTEIREEVRKYVSI